MAALPAARHPTAATQLTEFKKLSAVASGLGATDHEEPFQFSTKACGLKLLPPPPPNGPVDPAAQHCPVPVHEMPLKIAPDPVGGVGTDPDMSLQVEPSQCSMRTPDAMPKVGSVLAPEAQQSSGPVQARPWR